MAKVRLNNLRSMVKAGNEQKIIAYLASEGERLIKLAYASKQTFDDSKNQKDAYGYRVYLDGREVKTGFVNNTPESDKEHHGWAKHEIPPDTGRGYLMEFFDEYKPSPKGFELLVVNAIYYSQILEDGMQNAMHHKYRIISQIRDNFDNLEHTLKLRGYKTHVKTIRLG